MAGEIASFARGDGFGEDSTQVNDTVNHAEGQSSPVLSGQQGWSPIGRDSAKAAKKKAKSDAGSTSSAEHAARMQELSLQRIAIMQEEATRKNDRFQHLASLDEKRFEEMRRHNQALLEIEQEKMRLEQEKMRLEQDKMRLEQEKVRLEQEKQDHDRKQSEKEENERILRMDLNACPTPLRLYYQTLQEEILAETKARHRSRQAP